MKKTSAAFLALAFVAFFCFACDTVVEETVLGVGGTSNAKLYYPKDIRAPAAATTMSAGWTQNLRDIEWLSRRLAAEGYIVLGVTPTNVLGLVSDWTRIHKNGIAKLKDLNNNHRVLKGLIDTNKLQISGHSKGGGGSLNAAVDLNGDVASVQAFAPYCGGEYRLGELAKMQADVFVQAGSADTLAVNSMTREEYQALPDGISRLYKEYAGYGHMSWTTGSFGKEDKIAGDTIAWMKVNLDGDASAEDPLRDQSGTTKYDYQP